MDSSIRFAGIATCAGDNLYTFLVNHTLYSCIAVSGLQGLQLMAGDYLYSFLVIHTLYSWIAVAGLQEF